MGQAIGLLHREQVIALKKSGHTLLQISQELNLTYSSVRTIWGRFEKDGIAGLQTKYANCGKSSPDRSDKIYRAALWLKHIHKDWGAPRIHAGLKSRYKDKVPTIRTLNRWFKLANITKPRNKVNRESIGKSTAVHNIWQVDAKENLKLLDGQAACYLTIVDEKSGAWLASLIFPLWTYLSSTP